MRSGWRVQVIWTQWLVGVWWWPVRKDLAAGLRLGPLDITWARDREQL